MFWRGIYSELQWSHDLSAMDTRVLVICPASLRLLQWSHDLSAMDTMRQRRPTLTISTRFNGAMTSQPWILGEHYVRGCRQRASMEP